MNNGKFSRTSGKHIRKRMIAVLVSVTLLCAIAAGATIAYLIDQTNAVNNQFTPSQVTSFVDETFENGVKSNVKIQNTGDVSAFIRAEIVVTWKNDDGEILSGVPAMGTDYMMNLTTDDEGTKWFVKDGYFYFSEEVVANGKTTNLITEAKAFTTKRGTDGKTYYVSIEIISSAIQSQGVKADGITHPVEDAWKVTYNAGTPATIS